METVTGIDGRVWTRSADRRELTCEDGGKVIGNPDMSTEYLLGLAYQEGLTEDQDI
jgi:hypothetical protein